jgi:hypothetical protein
MERLNRCECSTGLGRNQYHKVVLFIHAYFFVYFFAFLLTAGFFPVPRKSAILFNN